MKKITIALTFALAMGAHAASAQSWPSLPLDESNPHKGFEFVERYNGVDWYSERGSRIIWLLPGFFNTGAFDLMRGSFVGGRAVQITIYEVSDTSCRTGKIRALAGGSGTTFEAMNQSMNWIGGPWHKPISGSPEAIRLGQICIEIQATSYFQGMGY